MSKQNQSPLAPGHNSIWPYGVPILGVGLLCLMYLISPEFYLKHVLHEAAREDQGVEILTVAVALVAGLLGMWAGIRLLRGRDHGLGAVTGPMIILVIALATLFFAAEEISWGQTIFGWKTPGAMDSDRFNLHNAETGWFEVQTAGSAFLIIMFFGLPLAWKLRRKWRLALPDRWAPAIPEGPVVFCMLTAFGWKEAKTLYKAFSTDEALGNDDLYIQFIEQFNEIKEMFVAIALLMYGLYRVRAVRRWLAQARPGADR